MSAFSFNFTAAELSAGHEAIRLSNECDQMMARMTDEYAKGWLPEQVALVNKEEAIRDGTADIETRKFTDFMKLIDDDRIYGGRRTQLFLDENIFNKRSQKQKQLFGFYFDHFQVNTWSLEDQYARKIKLNGASIIKFLFGASDVDFERRSTKGCFMKTGNQSGDRRPRINFGKALGHSNGLYVQRLLAQILHHSITLRGWESSYICDVPGCIRPFHIMSEPAAINKSRSSCQPPCAHVIKYVRVDADNMRCLQTVESIMQMKRVRKLQEAKTAFNAHTTAAELAFAGKWERPLKRLQAAEHAIATSAMQPRCSITALIAARPAHIEVGSKVNFVEMTSTFNNGANKQRLAHMLLLHDVWRSNDFVYMSKRGQQVPLTWTHVLRHLFDLSIAKLDATTTNACYHWPEDGLRVHTNNRSTLATINNSTTQFAGLALIQQLFGPDACAGREASHHCGNNQCERPSHLVPETHAQNLSRDLCFKTTEECPHRLACIRTPSAALTRQKGTKRRADDAQAVQGRRTKEHIKHTTTEKLALQPSIDFEFRVLSEHLLPVAVDSKARYVSFDTWRYLPDTVNAVVLYVLREPHRIIKISTWCCSASHYEGKHKSMCKGTAECCKARDFGEAGTVFAASRGISLDTEIIRMHNTHTCHDPNTTNIYPPKLCVRCGQFGHSHKAKFCM